MVNVLQIQNYALKEELSKLKSFKDNAAELTKLRETNECLEVDLKIIQDKYEQLMEQLNAFGAGFKKT
jgi:predicted nuclease with TOPRIM domain